VDRTTTVRENFNLFSPSDGWFSQDWMTGPSNREIFLRLAIHRDNHGDSPATPPSSGTVRIIGPAAGFLMQIKNPVTARPLEAPPADLPPVPETTPTLVADPFSTTVLALYTGAPHTHTVASVGDPLGRDYSVSAWIWCDYRPVRGAKPPGPDVTRVGIFARDSGQHQFGRKTELESGDALTMTYDSDDGRLRVGNIARGGFDDWRPRSRATYIKQSGWHHFRMDCLGDSVTYFLNGEALYTQDNITSATAGVRDYKLGPLFQQGDAGVFIETVAVPQGVTPPQRGVYFAGFRLEDLPQ
jgi:hypothetical protein